MEKLKLVCADVTPLHPSFGSFLLFRNFFRVQLNAANCFRFKQLHAIGQRHFDRYAVTAPFTVAG